MRCIEAGLRAFSTAAVAAAVAAALAACSPTPTRPAPPAPEQSAPASPVPASPAGPALPSPAPPVDGSPTASGQAAPIPPAASAEERGPIPVNPRYVKLAPPASPRSEAALRLQLAQRLIDAHPDSSYTSTPPERLLAIPVLEIDLNADGSVRDIKVLRKPTTGNQATVLAIAAVRRAAPYGDVSRLPKPWRVVETFLFDDHLRFKPRTLDTD